MRRSKAPLALMELLVMVLVFALAAALCLQVFAFADRLSRRNEAIDRAVTQCQTTAELLKTAGNKVDGWRVAYNEVWEETNSDPMYVLEVEPLPSDLPGLCRAAIRATDAKSGEILFELNTAWQEGENNG